MSDDCLSEHHLLLFGTIIQWFARYERIMLDIAAKVATSDYASLMILMSGLDFEGKRQALLHLLQHRKIPLDQCDHIRVYLGVPQALTRLRNDIAHATWISAPYTHWIQPEWILRPPSRIKPLANDPNAPTDGFVETEDEKIGYTIEDLEEAVKNLSANYENFGSYLREFHLISTPDGPQQGRLGHQP